jgi:hypothetical protein
MKEEFAVCQCEKTENQTEQKSPMLWLALKPTQYRHTVVSLVITDEVWLTLISSAASRGVSFGPQNV